MKRVAIIQARMGSTRLPGKVMKEILGRPMLELLVERVKRTTGIDLIVVATSTNAENDAIEELVSRIDIVELFRGSENDVLKRYCQAASEYGADLIMRITADNPFFDWILADKLIATFASGNFDYVSSGLVATFPYGIGAEVFSIESFRIVEREAIAPFEREHVTPYYYQNPDRFKLGGVQFDKDVSQVRLTVDTPEDFDRAVELFERFGEAVTFREIIDDCNS